MNAQNYSQAQAKKEQTSLLQFHGSNIAFEEIDGKMMVNATQMAKPFGKTPKDWLRTQQANDLTQTVSVRHMCLTNELQVVRQGGKNQGTWFHEDVALFFAQWLSPEFYLACNYKLKELLTQQALILPAKHGVMPIINEGTLMYPYKEVMRALGGSIKSSSSRRKNKYPAQFKFLFGRNFITSEYFDLLKGYYDYKFGANQLNLAL